MGAVLGQGEVEETVVVDMGVAWDQEEVMVDLGEYLQVVAVVRMELLLIATQVEEVVTEMSHLLVVVEWDVELVPDKKITAHLQGAIGAHLVVEVLTVQEAFHPVAPHLVSAVVALGHP